VTMKGAGGATSTTCLALYCRLRLSDRRTSRPSPLRTPFLRAAHAIYPSQGLPTQRRRRSDPNGTSPTRSRRCADGSSSHSPEPFRDVLAAIHRSAGRPEFLTTDAVRIGGCGKNWGAGGGGARNCAPSQRSGRLGSLLLCF
jgi:hypothetical protein